MEGTKENIPTDKTVEDWSWGKGGILSRRRNLTWPEWMLPHGFWKEGAGKESDCGSQGVSAWFCNMEDSRIGR